MTLSTTVPPLSLKFHRTVQAFRKTRKSFAPNIRIGFVPTMGALHEGHLSLVKEARKNNDIVVASIFVNPTQFGEGEGLDKYPRDLERDARLLSEHEVDHLFVPDENAMYGENHMTFVDPSGFDKTNEGKSRPGHFRGVATIVTKLFNIVSPTTAYFGQKDAAQSLLIRRIVQDLDMDVNVQILATVREEDGLAMSSRNANLTEQEKKAAPVIYQSLCAAKAFFDSATFPVSATFLKGFVLNLLNKEPMISTIQYVSIDCKETMESLEKIENEGAILSIACEVGSVRLIDNIVL